MLSGRFSTERASARVPRPGAFLGPLGDATGQAFRRQGPQTDRRPKRTLGRRGTGARTPGAGESGAVGAPVRTDWTERCADGDDWRGIERPAEGHEGRER